MATGDITVENVPDPIAPGPSFRTAMVIAGGKATKARATGYVADYLNQVSAMHSHDYQYNPFPRDSFIPNLILAIMKESGAVHLLDKINVPNTFHCPSRLYSLMIHLARSTGVDIAQVPRPPPHGTIIAFADDGLFPLLEQYSEWFKGVEEYYADVYDFYSNMIAADKK